MYVAGSWDNPNTYRRLTPPRGEEIRIAGVTIGYIEQNRDKTWSADRGLSWRNVTCPNLESREAAVAFLEELQRKDPIEP
jgi:hypothetical protein